MAGRLPATILTAVAAALLAAPASGQNQAQTQTGADAEATWTLPRTADGRPDFQGFWTTQTFTPAAATRAPRRQGVLHRRGSGRAPAAADRRGRGSARAGRHQSRGCGGERATTLPGEPRRLIRTLRQRDLAADAGPQGDLDSANVADHGSPPMAGFHRRRRRPSSARRHAPRRGVGGAPSMVTRSGRYRSAASSGRTTARRCCRRPTTIFISFFRRRATSCCTPS